MNKRLRISMKPTVKRLEWLHSLDVKWPQMRAFNRVGYDCMMAGWTEWNYIDEAGANYTIDEARIRYGMNFWRHTHINGERLTRQGKAVLEAAAWRVDDALQHENKEGGQ